MTEFQFFSTLFSIFAAIFLAIAGSCIREKEYKASLIFGLIGCVLLMANVCFIAPFAFPKGTPKVESIIANEITLADGSYYIVYLGLIDDKEDTFAITAITKEGQGINKIRLSKIKVNEDQLLELKKKVAPGQVLKIIQPPTPDKKIIIE